MRTTKAHTHMSEPTSEENTPLRRAGVSATRAIGHPAAGFETEDEQYQLALLSQTLDALSAHLAIIDDTGTILAVNGAWRRFAQLNGGDTAGFNVGDNYLNVCENAAGACGEEAGVIVRGLRSVIEGETQRFYHQYPCHTPDRRQWFQMRVTPFRENNPTRFVVSHENITEIKRVEEELRANQSELAHVVRLSTLGELAAGIAHELNQPLAAISNYASGCVRRLQAMNLGQGGESVTEALDEIAQQANRAGEIIRRLRNFVRNADAHRSTINITDAVRESIALIEPDARRRGVTVEYDLLEEPPPIIGDSIQIQQVVMNLFRNAVEAITGVGMGDYSVAHPGSAGTVRVSVVASDPQTVQVRVCDDGPGIHEEDIERVFQPFYTTKSSGLGLGLALCRSIIEAHGGELTARNNTDGGAEFIVALPMYSGDEHAGELHNAPDAYQTTTRTQRA